MNPINTSNNTQAAVNTQNQSPKVHHHHHRHHGGQQNTQGTGQTANTATPVNNNSGSKVNFNA